MSILYITNDKNILRYKNIDEQDLYILSTNKDHEFSHAYNCKEINLVDTPLEEVKLGNEFQMGYRIMLTVKKVISSHSIDEIIFNCSYLDAYFTMQFLMYGGEHISPLEVHAEQCYFIEINDNIYKFPYYWIQHLETKCKEMIDTYKQRYTIKTSPKLSIIIPYYNLGKYINETISSIRDSNYANYEIIIVNDGTTDVESIRILEGLKKKEDICIINQENKGLSVARNVGAEHATGKYITFLDADDIVESDYYSRAINVLEQYESIDIVYSWVRYFESKNEVWPTFDLTMPYLLLSNMSAAFYVIRRNQFMKYGLNRATMRKGMEDFDSLINMHSNGCRGVSIPEPLVKYRYRLGSMSKAFNPKTIVEVYNDIIEEHKEVYKQYSVEIMKLMNCNGPGYLWNNPTMHYPSVCLNANEDINDIKYTLIKLMNTKFGKLGIRILKLYKGKMGEK